jgi:phosphoglycolate phosphatase-like HAD superfamily hydrolase
MLNRVLPHVPTKKKTEILKTQGDRYRKKYPDTVQPFSGIHELFEALRKEGCRLAIATTCKKDELDRYDALMRVRNLCEVVVCGSDVKRGKPHPDLFRFVLSKLALHQHSQALAIGDTPYDNGSSRGRHAERGCPVLTGGFSEIELKQAGCASVVTYVCELRNVVVLRGPAERSDI